MPFDLDLIDDDWRAELSPEQLDALERRRRDVEPTMAMSPPTVAQGAPMRLVGFDRAELEQRRRA